MVRREVAAEMGLVVKEEGRAVDEGEDGREEVRRDDGDTVEFCSHAADKDNGEDDGSKPKFANEWHRRGAGLYGFRATE